MRRSFDTFSSVRMKGLEPIRRKTLDPKSSAATNYATSANGVANIHRFRKYAKRKPFVFFAILFLGSPGRGTGLRMRRSLSLQE